MKKDAMVANAADKKQVDEAKRLERDQVITAKQDMQELLKLPAFRRFIWRTIAHCGVFESTYSDSQALASHLSGRQDVGHYLLAEITQAQPEVLADLMREAYKEKSR